VEEELHRGKTGTINHARECAESVPVFVGSSTRFPGGRRHSSASFVLPTPRARRTRSVADSPVLGKTRSREGSGVV
jgi:hypothetical protein